MRCGCPNWISRCRWTRSTRARGFRKGAAVRKLFVLLLLGGAAYFLYAQVEQPKRQPRFTLPEAVAWRVVFRNDNSPADVQVCLVSGNRWRLESQSANRRRIVGVFDGSRFASSSRTATAEIVDPRPTLRALIEAIGKEAPEATELRDGRTCWRFTTSFAGKAIKVWLDTKTHFPVVVDGTLPSGERIDWHYSILALDLERNAPQYFNTSSTSPLFSNLLQP